MRLSKPSVTDIAYHQNCDTHLNQRICEILFHIKKKSTNYIKFITKAEFLGFKLLVVVLERQAIFYDCQDKKISRLVEFKYHNVRNKMINNHYNIMQQNRQKNYDQYNMMMRPQNGSQVTGVKNQSHNYSFKQNYQELDKVNSMSRRTQERPRSYSMKSRKNTNQTQQLKNIPVTNMKNSKVHSSASVCSQTFQQYKRANTLLDFQNPQIVRSITKMNRLRQKQKEKQRQKLKKQQIKVRSNDTASILKLITQSKIEGSIQTIKAYRNSIQSFQKYVQIDKNKLQKQKQFLEQYKPPSGVPLKFDYKKQINALKNKSKQLTHKRKQYMKQYTMHHETNLTNNKNKTKSPPSVHHTTTKSKTKNRYHTQNSQNQPIIIDQLNQKSHENQGQLNKDISPNRVSISAKLPDKDITSDAFLALEKKILQIQSISFCDNYMLVSLMNCQLRLYSFKKTIHGFSQTLIFQKTYQSVVTKVVLFKSSVRKMYNICVVLSKFSIQNTGTQSNSIPNSSGHMSSGTNNLNMQKLTKLTLPDQINLRQVNTGMPKIRQTQLNVYELDIKMQIQKQSYCTYLSYSPILVNMLPLGIGGYTESGLFFVLQLNCTSKTKSQIKSIDTTLYDPDNGKKVSISCMKCHKNLVSLYIGCKDGFIYIYDRLTETVRLKNKISNHEIIQIMFINQNNQMLYWDYSGKVGIINSDNLHVSNVVSIMSSVSKDSAGESNARYWAMLDYFVDDQFLIYGNRNIGLVSLFVNQEKKFHVQKPIKIFNRRLTLKNRKSITSTFQKIPHHTHSQQITTSSVSTNPMGSLSKKIYSYFSNPDSLIISTCQGEIIVYDRQTVYIGSYFSLNYRTLTKCANCSSIKYLYLLFENNQMAVINLYTQQQLISIINVKQEVYQIFFCHSSVYFCGFLSAKKYQLHIYGNIDQSYIAKKRKGTVLPLVVVSLYNIIMDITPNMDKDNETRLSKNSTKSVVSNPAFMDLSTHFYKGSMIIVKHQTAQILFLYKKSYTRNCVIRCQQHLPQHTPPTMHPPPPQPPQQKKISHKNSIQLSFCPLPEQQHKKQQPSTIEHSYLDNQSCTLSLLLSTHYLILINIQTKIVKTVLKLHTSIIRNYVTMGMYNCTNDNTNTNNNTERQTVANQIKKYKNILPEYAMKNIKYIQDSKNIAYIPVQHYFNLNDGIVTVLWRAQCSQQQQHNHTKYIYTQYNIQTPPQQPQYPSTSTSTNKQIKQINITHIVKSQPKQIQQKKPYTTYPQIYTYRYLCINSNINANTKINTNTNMNTNTNTNANNTNTNNNKQDVKNQTNISTVLVQSTLMKKNSYNNNIITAAQLQQQQNKNYIQNIKQGIQEWLGCPIILGQSFLTLNPDHQYFNLYKINKQTQNHNHKPKPKPIPNNNKPDNNNFDNNKIDNKCKNYPQGSPQSLENRQSDVIDPYDIVSQQQLEVLYYRIKPQQV